MDEDSPLVNTEKIPDLSDSAEDHVMRSRCPYGTAAMFDKMQQEAAALCRLQGLATRKKIADCACGAAAMFRKMQGEACLRAYVWPGPRARPG